jgi:rare lipoprotein A (peptidoglycan hydrolase)
MKSYLSAFLLAAGASLAAALPAAADTDALDWSRLSKSIVAPNPAPAPKVAARPAASPAASAKAAPVKVARATDEGDDSRPQRKAAPKRAPDRQPVTSGGTLEGVASYYWQPQPLASGGRFNPDALTAAHKTLPFGTRVRVTHARNGRSVEVVINDRGPYIAGRIIDLSRRAAQVIGMTDQGIARVNVAILGR